MTGGKIALLVLALLVFGLAFLSPAAFRGANTFLSFGLSGANRITAGELAAKFASSSAALAKPTSKFIPGDVFSRYPLNFKDRLLLDIGFKDGVKPGGAALSDGVLIGRVVSVSDNESVVQTVFDPTFNLAVRVGDSRADALLKGGVEPAITLVAKSARVGAGDMVYSAARDFEYGLPLGALGALKETPQNVFLEAPLILSYSPADLRYLFLERQ